MVESRRIKLSELQDDPENANVGTERGRKMLKQSIADYSFLEPGVIDRNGVIVAGNKRRAAASELGHEEAVIIKHDGKTPIYIQVDDLDLLSGDPRSREAAYILNRVAQVNLRWDESRINLDLSKGINLSKLFTPEELSEGFAPRTPQDDLDDSENPGDISDEDETDYSNETVPENWGIMVTCESEEHQSELLEKFAKEGLTVHALIS